MDLKVFRNACPRNCYGSCSMLSYVENGRLVKVSGDEKNRFNDGRLCAKGYSYTEYVYNKNRLKYPLRQTPRGSSNWERISWDEAYKIIAEKIIDLNDRYKSNLAVGYNKFSGNLGLLHYAVEAMFNSIGPHTKPVGNVCLATGEAATLASFGKLISPKPEDMINSKAVVIWGANPAVTNIHQMKFIYEAKSKGAKLIVIDPIFTSTAEKSDLYIQIKPGTDGLLALGIMKILLEGKDEITISTLEENNDSFKQFTTFINETIEIDNVSQLTGVAKEAIYELANLYKTVKPIATWNGFGIQRNENGGNSIKLINCLALISGNVGIEHGGVYYSHGNLNDFPLALYNFPEKKHNQIAKSREININNYPYEVLNLDQPPLKFLWIAARNTFAQDQHFNKWRELLPSLELIVTVDLFMTSTAKQSDIVLPAASHFEEEDLNISYWHHWLAINEKAIDPFYEAKSDLKIARELTTKLNELSPGFSTFPANLEPIDWIKKELSAEIMQLYKIDSYEDLLDGPKLKILEPLNDSKIEFSFPDEDKLSQFLNNINLNSEEREQFKFQLITPQSLLKIHTQFSAVSWLHSKVEETIVEINDQVATRLNIIDGQEVTIYNEHGSVTAIAKLNEYLLKDVLLVEQTNANSINQLVASSTKESDLNKSTPFYDCYVDIKLKKRGG